MMKIRGPLVDMLIELSPETYSSHVVQEGKSRVLYVLMVKALYGMLQSSLLYYKKFCKDIKSIGKEFFSFAINYERNSRNIGPQECSVLEE
jgi:hypothetical protein